MAYKPNCTACRATKNDAKVRKRIRYAFFERQEGDETLADIARELHVGIPSMYNHAKKHVPDMREADKRRNETLSAHKYARAKAIANKKLEVAFEKNDLNITENYEEFLDDYITQGNDVLAKGQMKITEKGFLAAIKIKADIQGKKRGQDIEIMKAVYSFSSGKNKKVKQNDESTGGVPGGLDPGERQPGDLYGAAVGDAAAQGTKGLYTQLYPNLVRKST